MLPRTPLGIAAASAGICFIGYCIYFDHKRRSHPNFKKLLREKRKKAKQSRPSGGQMPFPDLNDHDAMQKFFLEEVKQGEELLAAGDIEMGVEHLTNAVAICGKPQDLLQVLQQTLPPQVFQLLIQKLPLVSQRLSSAAPGPGAILTEDDVE
ncbi:hypothetical protein ScPMuIL_014273 [Solemya velum]